MTSAVFAHQGGWDEILVVLLPLLLFAGLLYVARRRAEQMQSQDSTRQGDEEEPKRP